MQEREAINMLENDRLLISKKSIWADLGCGDGTFTLALASFLHAESEIYAMDQDRSALNNIPERYKNCTIKKITGDFIVDDFPFQRADGILMANSLHYVKDKRSLIEKMKQHLNENGLLLIVEYDTDKSNRWVPYPISFTVLVKLFSDLGFSFIQKLHERKSVYNNAMMYSALLEKKDY